MAQRIWSCGCLPGSDCQVSSAEGGFRLVAVARFLRPGSVEAPKPVFQQLGCKVAGELPEPVARLVVIGRESLQAKGLIRGAMVRSDAETGCTGLAAARYLLHARLARQHLCGSCRG